MQSIIVVLKLNNIINNIPTLRNDKPDFLIINHKAVLLITDASLSNGDTVTIDSNNRYSKRYVHNPITHFSNSLCLAKLVKSHLCYNHTSAFVLENYR